MALVDTTVEQSFVSSAEGARGRECVPVEDGSPRGGKGWDGGMGTAPNINIEAGANYISTVTVTSICISTICVLALQQKRDNQLLTQ
jgi:hypothetical protein